MFKKTIFGSTATLVACLAVCLLIAAGVFLSPNSSAQTQSVTFYRAINLNGRALTIDGQTWEASTTANYTVSGGSSFCNQAVALNPTTDAARGEMLRCSIWNSAGSNVTLTSVPSGTYDVYLYVWEDNYGQVYSLTLEGEYVQMNYHSGAAGQWARLGPWRTTVSDGTLEVKATGGDANFSGIEVYRVNTAPTPPPANAIANGTYKITAKHSGKALDVANASSNNGARVIQYDYVGGANQKWRVESLGDGTYKILALHSGKTLDVANASQNNGAVVHQWDYYGIDNQRWRIEATGNGFYRVTAKHSGKALEVSDSYQNNGAEVAQWDYVGQDNQQWKFEAVTAATPTPTPTPTPGNWIDVKSSLVGAKGDGVTDDAAALTQVVAKAAGKSIYFPPGTYLVSRPIVWSGLNNQIIRGDNATIKAAPNWNNGGRTLGILTLTDARSTTVRNLAIQGFYDPNVNYNNAAKYQEALAIRDSINVTVESVMARNAQTGGIVGERTTGLVVRNSKALSIFGTGMGCGSCTDTTFLSNEVVGTADPNATSVNNYAGIGLFVQKGSGALIENNLIRNWWDTATKTEGTSNVIYRGNTVDTYGKDGIKIMFLPANQGGANQPVYNGVIENNVVRNFKHWKWDGSGGFALQGVTDGRVTNNTYHGPGYNVSSNGITLSSYSTAVPQTSQVTVEDNTIYDSKVGMLVETTDATMVRRNKFLSSNGARNMKHCVNIGRGNGTVLEDNIFEGFTDSCVLVYGSTDNLTILRDAFKNGQAGVWLNANDSTGVKILYNNFENVTQPLPYQGTVAQCSGNTSVGTGTVRPECR